MAVSSAYVIPEFSRSSESAVVGVQRGGAERAAL